MEVIDNGVHIAFLPFACCAALGKLLNLSESRLSNGANQWCTVHVLQLAPQEKEKLCFVALADFRSVNIHHQANNHFTASLQNSCQSTNQFSETPRYSSPLEVTIPTSHGCQSFLEHLLPAWVVSSSFSSMFTYF